MDNAILKFIYDLFTSELGSVVDIPDELNADEVERIIVILEDMI